MAHAYTPGLKVTEYTLIRRERRLPLKGDVLASMGDEVTGDTVVARTELPGDVQPLNLAGLLGVAPQDLAGYLSKKPGDKIQKDETIAETKGFFGLMKNQVKSPINGTIESISNVTGQAILRNPPTPVEVDAYIDGKVVEIFKGEGVTVETYATFVQGIFGIGGEVKGIIVPIVESPKDPITIDMITPELKGKVAVGGSLVTVDVIRKAVDVGCIGIVSGGIWDYDLREFLGYDIGVAITGSEEKGITIIITEGFGEMPMAEKTFRLLKENSGKKASINGATQIRAGVMRPEVIIPKVETKKTKEGDREDKPSKGVEIGSPVRIIREPHFGNIGKVTALPSELQVIETEAKVRVLEAELENGERVIVPRANVELIEE
ncbi:hypothetical protein CH333_04525 [candidate division WOR-3 bacterium JGI_Cruoil_03_44_89]|uniref:KOW domain-containing protein n=1 Tax=candidate division WOR-3 bacterium JGI_Cruoil_03_44_89 TaxID=1973748 RepID=A0A235BU90_UNCW3|nr:MAG: hypothetical protein CH333_04525 [candidate division WOR-3 bacterium JGI_Cruoil_03_44_89]